MDMGRAARIAYLALGLLFVGLGFAGAILPVLPTTPFLLVALWAFSKSSPRFHHWLYDHRIFGPSLREFTEYRVIPTHVKFTALIFMTGGLTLLWWKGASPLVLGTTVFFMSCGGLFILSCPSTRPVSTSVASQNE
jgi:uncharacterized membrane protein YbaN (DUF454 family)